MYFEIKKLIIKINCGVSETYLQKVPEGLVSNINDKDV